MRLAKKIQADYRPFTGGPSTSIMALILISIEVVLAGEWLIIQQPDVEWIFNGDNTDYKDVYPVYNAPIWRCQHTETSMIVSLCYVYVLQVAALFISIR